MNTDRLLRMLLEAIDYSFLQTNGDYDKSLTYPVIDKVKYIKEKLKNNEVKVVDLEKECDNWRHNHFHGRRDKEASGEYLERSSQLDLVKYFFELGLNTQKG